MHEVKDRLRKRDLWYVRHKFQEDLGFIPPMRIELGSIWIDKNRFFKQKPTYSITLDMIPEFVAPAYIQHYEVWGPSMEESDGDKYFGFDKAIERAIELWKLPPDDNDYFEIPPDAPMPKNSIPIAAEKYRISIVV